MDNRFFVTKSHTIDAAIHLEHIGYEEMDSVIKNENDAEPIKILIDSEDRAFYFIDDAALKDAAKIISHKHKQEIQSGLITNILNWK